MRRRVSGMFLSTAAVVMVLFQPGVLAEDLGIGGMDTGPVMDAASDVSSGGWGKVFEGNNYDAASVTEAPATTAESGEDAVGNSLIGQLSDSSTMSTAMGLLGDMEYVSAAPALWSIVKDTQAYTSYRSEALDTLGKIGYTFTKEDYKFLSALAQEDNDQLTGYGRFNYDSLRKSAVGILGAAGYTEAGPVIVSLLKDTGNNRGLRCEAASALGEMKYNAAGDDIFAVVKNENEDAWVRAEGVKALQALNYSQAAEYLISTLGNPPSEAWNEKDILLDNTVQALISMGKGADVVSFLKNWDPEAESLSSVHSTIPGIIRSLSEAGYKDACPVLLTLAGDKRQFDSTRNAAIEALVKLGYSQGWEELLDIAKNERDAKYAFPPGPGSSSESHPNTSVARTAVKALADLKITQATADMVAMVKDKNEHSWVRMETAQALGIMGNSAAGKDLLAIAKDSENEYYVRENAVKAIGEIGYKEACGDLLSMLKDKNNVLRESAAYSLGKLGYTPAADTLLSIAKDTTEYSGLRENAITALVNFKYAGAGKDLAVIASNTKDNNTVRILAIESMVKLGYTVSPQGLLSIVNNRSEHIQLRETALQALTDSKYSGLDSEKLVSILRSRGEDVGLRCSVLDLLAAGGGLDSARDTLYSIIQDREDSEIVRGAAVLALREGGFWR